MARAPAAAAVAAAARLFRRRAFARARRREGGKFLVQPGRAAVRTFRPAPVGGAHEDFAVAFALAAMKFVEGHGGKIMGAAQSSSAERRVTVIGQKNRGKKIGLFFF